MIHNDDALTLGRGELYFQPLDPATLLGQGELYLGNTPSLTFNRKLVTVDRMKSEGGRLYVDESFITQETFAGAATTDNISQDNVKAWFSAKDSGLVADSISGASLITAYPGRYYQLGESVANPAGRRNLLSATPSVPGHTMLPSDFEVDLLNGRIRVSPETTIPAGSVMSVAIVALPTTEKTLIPSSELLLCSLRFIGLQLAGPRRSFFFPLVEMRASGDMQLKGDAWQQMSFDISIRKRRGREFFYATDPNL